LDPILISKHQAKMEFCIRDDDTSYFTMPDDLEKVYGPFTKGGPVSLAVVPFHRAGTSGCVPDQFRGRGTVHPLHENQPLVRYLRNGVSTGRFEIMLHGYHHDEPDGLPEFMNRKDPDQRVSRGRKYLEDLLGAAVRVFVPPGNTIGSAGLRAIAREGLHLGGTAGIRAGWSLASAASWRTWIKLRNWRRNGGVGVPWILDLGDHREIPGNAVTPAADFADNQARFRTALAMGGVFCIATHYWEMNAPSLHENTPRVGEHLRRLIELAMSNPQVVWRSVGDVVSQSDFVA
jgi:peptidoglycan/xylan/chitin deacetylase (PgdA/CDA1 family)